MLIDNGDQTYTAGPLDAAFILKDVNTGRFHVCLCEERPMPGPVGEVEDLSFVRLRSKGHHTVGAETLEGAQAHMEELRKTIFLTDDNVSLEPVDWDGQVFQVLVPNWKKLRRNVELGSLI